MGSIARRGVLRLVVESERPKRAFERGVFGQRPGYGANYELARIVDAFRLELPEDKLTFNVGLIAGGTTAKLSDKDEVRNAEVTGKTNIIAVPRRSRAAICARFRTEQLDRATAKMRAIVGESAARRESHDPALA